MRKNNVIHVLDTVTIENEGSLEYRVIAIFEQNKVSYCTLTSLNDEKKILEVPTYSCKKVK